MNPTRSNRILFLLALAGAGVAGYLTFMHAHHFNVPCGPLGGGCDAVANHPTARGFGIPALEAIPTAAFGLLTYLLMAGLCFARAAAPAGLSVRRLALAQWFLAKIAALASAWLTWLEIYVIHAVCIWCLSSAIIAFLIFLIATGERLTARPSDPVPSAGEA